MSKKIQNVLIVGAGVAGRELLEQLSKHLRHTYKVVGFIDDDPKKRSKKINGQKVLGQIEDLAIISKRFKVNEIFIAIPSANGDEIRRIVEECEKQKILFKIVPRILEIVLGKVKLEQVREVQIEDLVGRPIIRSEQEKLKQYFSGKKILVTGAAGSIGSELCRQIIQFTPKKLIALDVWESGLFNLSLELETLSPQQNFKIIVGNIQDYDKLLNLIPNLAPEMIFHCAAYKHVPLMQENIIEAVKNNVFGTENLVEVAKITKVKKFINISTDKAANPSSIMGVTKLITEKFASGANSKKTRFISVRFGNVLDSQGSVVPIFRKQIIGGGPVTVTDPEMSRYFMTIPEAVQLVLQASILGDGGETFVLDMGKPVKIDDLARLMIKLSGFVPDQEIQIKYTGKRPGEKISEVLTTENEILQNTTNKKIFKIMQNSGKSDSLKLDKKVWLKYISDLKNFVKKNDERGVYNLIKSIAPNVENI